MSFVKDIFSPPKVKRPQPPPAPPQRAQFRGQTSGAAPTGAGQINPSLISTSSRGALTPARGQKRALIGGSGA